MKKKKKVLFNFIFLTLCIGLTVYYVFRGEDFSEVAEYIEHAKGPEWLVGILLVFAFILSESVIIFYLMGTLKEKPKLSHCCLYSFVGFFFSLVTPTASGGQPMQLVFMNKDKLSAHVSTITLMIVTIAYKAVLVLLGLFVLIFRPAVELRLLRPAMPWVYLGLVLNVICVTFMLAVVWSPEIMKGLVQWFVGIMRRHLHKAGKQEKLERLEAKAIRYMDGYKETSVYVRRHKQVSLNVLGITLVQRCLLFAVTYVVLRSFGIHSLGLADVIVLQGTISLAVDMLPLPGGLGISEHLFQLIFLPVCGAGVITPAMIISRGLSFYAQLLISAVFTVAAYFLIFGRREKNDRIL